MKKLLILAGAGVHCKVVDAAKEMGIYTIVTDYLKDSPAKLIADESLMYDINDVNALVNFCKENNVDGVLGFCIDPSQKPAQAIAERIGANQFGDRNQVFALTDKVAFKKLCTSAGVDIIPEYNSYEIDYTNIQFPVLVKPIDSRGSRGASVCKNIDELKIALPMAKKESSNGGAIIEKYMDNNQDLTISYIVKDGEPILISVGDRYPGKAEDNLDRQLSCTIQPSIYMDMYVQNVNNRVINMIKKLGIQNGPVFMQGFVDGDTVRMYDPGIRLPGNEYERIFTCATGMNPMKSIISYIVGGEINDYDGGLVGSYNLNGKCAIQYMINVKDGEIAVFEGLDSIQEMPFVIDVQQKHFIGDIIKNTGDIRHRAGEISILVNRNIEEMSAAVELVQSTLHVRDTDGNNMLISEFNKDLISKAYGG